MTLKLFSRAALACFNFYLRCSEGDIFFNGCLRVKCSSTSDDFHKICLTWTLLSPGSPLQLNPLPVLPCYWHKACQLADSLKHETEFPLLLSKILMIILEEFYLIYTFGCFSALFLYFQEKILASHFCEHCSNVKN